MTIDTSSTTQCTYQDLLDIWRHCLAGERFTEPHEGVIDELGRFFGLPPEKVRWICEHSAEITAEEWRKTGQSAPEDLHRFYQAQTYWLFGTLRYHANQVEPNAVLVANALQHHLPMGHHLDFGCGVATASLFFKALGWQTSLGDVSELAVNFARWRFEQREIQGKFYHLEVDRLPPNTYDLITAFDVMGHIADIPEVLRRLYQSLKLGGYLVFNVDTWKPTARNPWLLYDAQYPVIRHVRQAGSRWLPKISIFFCYQKIELSPLNAAAVGIFDRLQYNRFMTVAGEQIRRLLRPYKETIKKVRM